MPANATKASRTLKVSCHSKEPKDDYLIGEGEVDISETLETGEFDGAYFCRVHLSKESRRLTYHPFHIVYLRLDWVTLKLGENAYRGEVYLEMTFFATDRRAQLARRASKLSPNERLSRPTQPYSPAQSNGHLHPNPHRASSAGGLAPQTSQVSISPPKKDDPLPPVPVAAGGIPESLRPAVGKPAGPARIPTILRPGGPPHPSAAVSSSSAPSASSSPGPVYESTVSSPAHSPRPYTPQQQQAQYPGVAPSPGPGPSYTSQAYVPPHHTHTPLPHAYNSHTYNYNNTVTASHPPQVYNNLNNTTTITTANAAVQEQPFGYSPAPSPTVPAVFPGSGRQAATPPAFLSGRSSFSSSGGGDEEDTYGPLSFPVPNVPMAPAPIPAGPVFGGGGPPPPPHPHPSLSPWLPGQEREREERLAQRYGSPLPSTLR